MIKPLYLFFTLLFVDQPAVPPGRPYEMPKTRVVCYGYPVRRGFR